MMERLTMRVKGVAKCAYESTDICYETQDCHECVHFQAMVNELADAEDAEESGRLVVLPCKAGDTVYGIVGGSATALVIKHIIICETVTTVGWRVAKPIPGDGRYDYINGFNLREIGKTVFLTHKEAEAALAEREEVR